MDGETSRGDSMVIRGTLEAFRLRLCAAADASDAGSSFMASFGELLRWVAGQADDGVRAELEESGYVAEHFEFFARCQRRYLTAQEMVESAALLARPRPAGTRLARVLDSEFGQQTYQRVAEALELASFSDCRRFVMIGCGPFPAAALFVHDHTTTAEIIAVDKDPQAIELAARLAAAFAPERVCVTAGDGTCFDYGSADVVYVANHVTPKARVLRRIAATADKTTQVILRDPFGYGRLFAESGVADLDPRFVVAATGEGHPHFLSQHVRLAWRDR